MRINLRALRVKPTAKVNLSRYKTRISPVYSDSDDYEKILREQQSFMKTHQEKLFASGDYSFLLIIQGMDTSGKDGAIAHVISGINPQGCRIANFKEPSPDELKHDFLWRTVAQLPPRGYIGVFNRSYYEDVLITRIHPEVFAHERIPPKLRSHKGFWKDRLKDICHHESYLERQGTRIIKIFLHISKEEQAHRLKSRLEDPHKIWKANPTDFAERKYWKQYKKAYEDAITHTSTKLSPWFVVPGDDKKNARLIVSEIINSELKALHLHPPKLPKDQLKKLRKLAKDL